MAEPMLHTGTQAPATSKDPLALSLKPAQVFAEHISSAAGVNNAANHKTLDQPTH